MLDPETFRRRHLLLCWVLALHIPVLGIFGVVQGFDLETVLLEMATPLVCLVAARAVDNRRLAAFFVTAGLVFCSSVLVHFSGGMIEAHFHFFVIIGLIALYQDWVPFLWNVVFTVLSHGLGSAFAEDSMFNHPAGIDNPWTWALIHGVAVLAACIGVIVFWKNTELEQQRSGRLAIELAATEVTAAQQEAAARRSVSELLVNLARRNQGLLDRQLALIADLEQRQRDPEPLGELFQLDHLATRIRRNAESLLVLSGDEPARLWGHPQPLAEVVRAAAAEIEHYQRVDVEVNDYLDVAGQIVADLAHLLAELIENATTFSPPDSRVRVRSHIIPSEWSTIAVSVEDTGMGMSDADMTSANQVLAYAPEVDLRSSTLGFHVVSRLAARYGLQVRLAHTPGGGVTALVALPNHLVTERSYPAIPAPPVNPLPPAPPVNPLPPPPPPPPVLAEPRAPAIATARVADRPFPPPPEIAPAPAARATEPPAAEPPAVEPVDETDDEDSPAASVPDDLPVGAGAPDVLTPLDEPAAFEPPAETKEPEAEAEAEAPAVEPEPVATDEATGEPVRTPPYVVPDGPTEALPDISAPTVTTGVVRTPPYIEESVLDRTGEEPPGPAPIRWRWKDGKRVDQPDDEATAKHLRKDTDDEAAADSPTELAEEPASATADDADPDASPIQGDEPAEELPKRVPGQKLAEPARSDADAPLEDPAARDDADTQAPAARSDDDADTPAEGDEDGDGDGGLPRREPGAALPPLLATPLPDTNGSETAPPAPEVPRTSAGLARRIPGAALAPALRRPPKSDDGDTSNASADDPLADRERVRSMLSQFQAGQMAGRAAGVTGDPPGGQGRPGNGPGPDSEDAESTP